MESKYKLLTPMLILVVLLSSAVAAPFYTASAQNQRGVGGEVEATVEKLLELMEKTERHIEATFQRLEERNVTMPEAAKERLAEGLAKAEAAIEAFRDGRVEDAGMMALDAMRDFRTALESLEDLDVIDRTPAGQGINQAVNRTLLFIDKLKSIMSKAEELGYNVTEFRERIREAEAHLANATRLAEEGSIPEAARELGRARRILAGLEGEIRRITKGEKVKKVERFAAKALKELEEIEAKVDELPIPPENAEAIKSALQNARHHIEQARASVDREELKDAIDELEEMAEGVQKLEKEKPVKIAKLERKMEKLKQKIESIGVEVDVSTAEALLKEAQGLIDQAKASLEAGDLEAIATR